MGPDHVLDVRLELIHGLIDALHEGVVTADLAAVASGLNSANNLLGQRAGVDGKIRSDVRLAGLLDLSRVQRLGRAKSALDDSLVACDATNADLLLVQRQRALSDELGVDVLGLVLVAGHGSEPLQNLVAQICVGLVADLDLLHQRRTLLGGDGNLASGLCLFGHLGHVINNLRLVGLDDAQLLDVAILLGLQADFGDLVLGFGSDERRHLKNLGVGGHDEIRREKR